VTLPPAPDRWTIELANAERADAVAAFGFTDRQARFLVHVLLHAGVFVERQYCHFAGIAHGQKTADFLNTLVDRRYATPIATGALHRGRMFHVHYKPLWAAIGEPDSRFRKPAAPGRLIERVMLLDAVLSDPAFIWLGPSRDKTRYFIRDHGDRVRQDDYPHLTFGDGPDKSVRYFPDKLPIGVQPYAIPHVFLYLVTRPSPVDFRAFLLRHRILLGHLYRWTIRLLFPRPLARAALAYQHAAREHLAMRLEASTADELAWFFHERRRLADAPSAAPDRRFQDDATAFAAPRFSALYRAWMSEGDPALWVAQSVAVPDAVSRGEGQVECVVLAHQYLHLAPLVGMA
jgi:hypothetical protein